MPEVKKIHAESEFEDPKGRYHLTNLGIVRKVKELKMLRNR